MFARRVTIFVGHFGSGKTEIALNGALQLAAVGEHVTLADLDVVKPYFRSRAARALLADVGIDLLAPQGESIFGDLPIIVPQIRSALHDPRRKVVVDVGGDDTGARVLGSLADVIQSAETHCLVVLNFCRPFTRTVDEAVEMVRLIEAVARISVTGLVSNTHLMDETTGEVVREGYELALATAHELAVPLLAVTVDKDLADRLGPSALDCPLVHLRRIVRPPFDMTLERRTTGPLFVVS